MPFAKDGKIRIKILFSIKEYNVKDLVGKFPSKGWNIGLVYKLLQKLRIAGSVSHRPAAADDAAPAQLITLSLFTNWYHTKVAKWEIIFAHCRLCAVSIVKGHNVHFEPKNQGHETFSVTLPNAKLLGAVCTVHCTQYSIVYKNLSKLVGECWRYSKPKQSFSRQYTALLKDPISGVHVSPGSAET